MEKQTKYNAIRDKIKSVVGRTALYTATVAFGLSIGEYLPSWGSETLGRIPETVSTYKDTNDNGLYDTIVRESPNGRVTTQRLGGDNLDDYVEVSREQIEREQIVGGLYERIVFE